MAVIDLRRLDTNSTNGTQIVWGEVLTALGTSQSLEQVIRALYEQGLIRFTFTNGTLAQNVVGNPYRSLLPAAYSPTQLSQTLRSIELTAGTGNDTVYGTANAETIKAGDGNDWVHGGAGNDTLLGEVGNDTLIGGAGADTLTGGSGKDTYVFESVSDSVNQVGQYDRISDFSRAQGDRVDLSALGLITWNGKGGALGGGVASAWYAPGGGGAILFVDRDGNGSAEMRIDLWGTTTIMAADLIGVTKVAPTTIADTSAVKEDVLSFVSGNVLTNDSDVDGAALQVTSVNGQALALGVGTVTIPAQHGTLVIGSSGSYSYILRSGDAAVQRLGAGEQAFETFTYVITNGSKTSTATLTIVINGTNDGPRATADYVVRGEDGAVAIAVLANDIDQDVNDVLTVQSAQIIQGQGKVAVNPDGTIAYDPDGAYNHLKIGQIAQVVIRYVISDGKGGTATANATVTVTGANDAPVVTGAVMGSATEGGSISILDALANASDADGGATLSVVGVPASLPAGVTYANGQFILDPSVSVYQHLAAGQTTTVTVSYGISDGTATTPASVRWTVTGTNDGPVAVADAASGTENQTLTIDVLANDTDVDEEHVFTLVSALAPDGQGTASVVGGKVVFDPGTDFDHLPAGAQESVTLTYTMQDEYGEQSTASVTVTITGTNDAALITVGASNDATVTEDSDSTAGGQLVITDADSGEAAIKAATGGTYGTFTIGANGAWTYALNNAHAAVQALGATGSLTDSITVESADGTGTHIITVTIVGSNDGPLITSEPQTGTVKEDEAITASGHVQASDTDQATALSYAIQGSADGTYGSLSLNEATGEWTYTLANAAHQDLAAGESHKEIFTVLVSDGQGGTTSQIVTITVQGTNDAPTVSGTVTSSATEDGGVSTLDPLARVYDADAGANLSVVGVPTDLPAGVTYTNGEFALDPSVSAYQGLAVGQTTTVTVSYSVSDGTVTTPASVSWTVTGTNDGPLVVAAAEAVDEDGTISGSVAGTDTDQGETATLVYALVNAAPTGLIFNADGSYTFDASSYDALAAGGSQMLTIPFMVTDAQGTTSPPANLVITITGSNDGPVAVADVASGEENEMLTLDVLANDTDVDEGAVLTLVSALAPEGRGIASVVGGKIVFIPGSDFDHLAAGAQETVAIAYTMQDERGIQSSSSVTVTITGTNDTALVTAGASDDTAVTEDSDTTAGGQLVITDADAGEAAVKFATGGTYGTFNVETDGTWTYALDNTHPAVQALGATGSLTDSIMVEAADGTGTHIITVTITGTNDGPVAVADTDSTTAGTAVRFNVLANDTDPDAGAVLTVVSASASGGGSVTSNGDGTLTYDPGNAFAGLAAGASVQVTVTYTVADEHGATSTVVDTIIVFGQNDGPTAVVETATTYEDNPVRFDVLANDADPDGDALMVTSATVTGAGSVTINDDGTLTYDPGAAFNHLADGATAQVSITYTVEDTSGATSTVTGTITVTGANDSPSGVPETASTTARSTVTFNVLGNDSDPDDGAELTVVTAYVSGGGTVADHGDGTLTYNPGEAFTSLAAGAMAQAAVIYTIADEHGATWIVNDTVTVTGVNDGPTAVGESTSTDEDTAVILDVLANDVDPDDGAVLSILTASASKGSVVDNGDGTLTFVPGDAFGYLAGGGSEQVAITYTITDEHGATSTVTDTVTVTGVNDAPSAAAGSQTVSDRTPEALDLLENDSDPDDGDVISLLDARIVDGSGSLTVAGGVAIFDPGTDFLHLAAGQTDTVTVSYTVQDGHGATATATHTVVVHGFNDAPTPVDDQAMTDEAHAVSLVPLANDRDPESDAVFLQSAALASGSLGSVTVQDGTITYDPNGAYDGLGAGQSAVVDIVYTVRDDHGASATAHAYVTVTGVANNHAPTATNLTQTKQYAWDTVQYAWNTPLVALDNIVVSDQDGDAVTATLTLASPTVGWLTTTGGGSYDNITGVWSITGSVATVNAALAAVAFMPSTAFAVDTTITVSILDSSGVGPAPSTITLDVAPRDLPTTIISPATMQYNQFGGGDTTPFNRFMLVDPDTTGPVSVTITRISGDGTFSFVGTPAGGGATTSGPTTFITGTVAAINAWIAGNNLILDSEGNDADTFNITVGAATKPSVAVSEVTFTSTNGQDSNLFAGVNVFSPALSSGNQSDTLYTSWNHVGAAATAYDGGNANDTVNLLFTARQLQEVMTTTAFRSELQTYVNNPNGDILNLSTSSWRATAAGFETANFHLVDQWATRTTNNPANSYVDLTAWKQNLGLAPNLGLGQGSAGNDLIIGTATFHSGSGGDGNDMLVASGVVAATIRGEAGNDLILGGNANETLSGGAGTDVLAGGAGADTFVFAEADGDTNLDRIADYNFSEGDRLDLSGVLDGVFTPGQSLDGFMRVAATGTNDIVVQVDPSGQGTNFPQGSVVVLEGVLAGNSTGILEPIRGQILIHLEGHDYYLFI
ncbi:VCBS domain-containing protein [Microvirga sp. BT689]|uniref:Ig-like domain-containing protein n=1 Tax=Microvirga arvi TaxID=2778731 RepID=UPI0019509B3F|nr:Ig-like domain-containing protein [Microvirga arvi]MBM6583183.1 VCBS domain-containing protein [Microvirga arvi]